jgi:hypothetical protein
VKRTTLAAALLGALMASSAFAQAVQLPTFQFFSVQTTVSVPDRGGAYLGGVSRAASGRVSRGVPLLGKVPGVGRLGRNDAIGSVTATSGVGISATIIDHEELDKATLAEAARLRGRSGIASEDAALRGPVLSETKPVESVAEIRRRHAEQDAGQRQEALALLEKGRRAEAAGKTGVAKVYYEMAARRADPALQEQIAAHLTRLAAAHPQLAKGG